ncbi:MAG: hypothetical protein M1824_001013 [Vezdaea acicularis]|nr:MAG: hypothetical protein M1824_001013 [Vezdaea acicularis]
MSSTVFEDPPYGTSSAELQFPTLCLDPYIGRCLRATTIPDMSSLSTSVQQNEKPGLSCQKTIPLGESSYDILGRSANSDSDEDENDETVSSIASFDGHGRDDVVSLADTEESGEAASTSSHDESHGIPAYGGLDDEESPPTLNNSIDNGVAVADEEDAVAASIEFQEPPSFGDGEITAIHTIRSFDDRETSMIIRNLAIKEPHPQRFAATVRQTMTKQGLAVDGSFRVLYIGDTVAKDAIVSKFGEALAVPLVGMDQQRVHQKSSRFSVVPISEFGSRGSPRVELIDSFGIELIVDECTTAKTTRTNGQNDTVAILVNDSLWYHSRRGHNGAYLEPAERYSLPDVAIFYCSDNDSIATRQTRRYTTSFMARHHVPAIFISQSPMYIRQPSDFWAIGQCLERNSGSIHLCLESRHADIAGNKIHTRLPIDLHTFLNIDARQMNRNLACITKLYADKGRNRPERQIPVATAAAVLGEDIEKVSYDFLGLSQSFQGLRKNTGPGTRVLTLIVSLAVIVLGGTAITVLAYFTGMSPFGVFEPAQDAVQIVMAPTTALAVPTNVHGIVPSVSSNMANYKATVSSLASSATPNGLAIGPQTDLANVLLDPSATTPNKSDKFEMHVIGDCHMVLRPPHRFTSLKRAPKLFVKVERNQQPVEVQLSKLFDGVYALKLEREDAYGRMNVSVWTKSKPMIEQTFELDFGTPWLKIASWRKAAQLLSTHLTKDLRSAQIGIQGAFGQITQEIQPVLEIASKQVKIAGKKIKDASLKKQAQTKAVIALKTNQIGSDILSRSKSISKELVGHAGDASVALSRSTVQLFKTATTMDVSTIWKGRLHPVKLTEIWPRAVKHAQIIYDRTRQRKLNRETTSKKTRRMCKKGCKKTCRSR